MKHLYLILVFILVVTASGQAQNLKVLRSKRVYTYQSDKIRKGQILYDEIVYGGNGAKLTLIDGDGFSFTYKPGNIKHRAAIDSIHRYFKKMKPISDKLMEQVNCRTEMHSLSVGNAEVSGPKYRIKPDGYLTGEDSTEVRIAWEAFMQNGNKFSGKYYLLLKDSQDHILELNTTSKPNLTTDIAHYWNHPYLVFEIRTLDPCGKSDEFLLPMHQFRTNKS